MSRSNALTVRPDVPGLQHPVEKSFSLLGWKNFATSCQMLIDEGSYFQGFFQQAISRNALQHHR